MWEIDDPAQDRKQHGRGKRHWSPRGRAFLTETCQVPSGFKVSNLGALDSSSPVWLERRISLSWALSKWFYFFADLDLLVLRLTWLSSARIHFITVWMRAYRAPSPHHVTTAPAHLWGPACLSCRATRVTELARHIKLLKIQVGYVVKSTEMLNSKTWIWSYSFWR